MPTNVVSPEVLLEEGRVNSEALPMSGNKLGYLECKNVGYSVKNFEILKNINLSIAPGRLTALMGSSGAGKTTLLTVLSGRGRGKVTGEALINGEKITRDRMKKTSKLVAQHDHLEPVLTAREVLTYTAELALNLPKKERTERVNQVIEQLSLESCADVVCGGADLKGLSGGQLKRVSIGTELLSNPSVLYLDEPTSGLDSKVAEDVVDILSVLARAGRTVICTIHQPSFQVFAKFDSLILLDKGKVVYNGPTASVSKYLVDIGNPTPEFVNPADHFLFVMTLPVPEGKADYAEVFEASEYQKRAENRMDLDKKRRISYVEEKGNKDNQLTRQELRAENRVYPTSFGSQVSTIFRRSFVVTLKDKRGAKARILQLVFIALIVGTIYLRLENKQSVVQDKLSVLFLLVLFLGMSSIMQTAMAIPFEKPIILREHANNYYSTVAFYIGRVGVLLFFQVFYALLFAAAIYFVIGLRNTAEAFFVFMAVMVLNSLIAGSAGLLAGILVDNPQGAAAVVPMVVMPLTIFAGLFIRLENIPDYWVWLYYISWFQYAISTVMINEFDGAFLNPCTEEEFLTPGKCPFGACSEGTNSSFSIQPCPGDVVLDFYEYNPDDMGRNFAILFGYVIALSLLGAFALKRLLRKTE